MTKVFNEYAAYYDLLYKEKDYKKEAEYIHCLIQKNNPGAKTILELGCGTGGHAVEFLNLDYEITGIDFSEQMIAVAKVRNMKNAHFLQDDIRTVRLNKKFDAVVALFHVMSYQTENKDLFSVFKTAGKHLKKNGVFIFDCWYGPCFLTDLPEIREKKMENEQVQVHRISTSKVNYHKNRIDVHFEIKVKNKKSNHQYTVNETHKMRYLFLPELICFSEPMKIVAAYDWMYEKLTLPRYLTVICKNNEPE